MIVRNYQIFLETLNLVRESLGIFIKFIKDLQQPIKLNKQRIDSN